MLPSSAAREVTLGVESLGKVEVLEEKVQEQIDVQIARELEEEMARDAHRMNEHIARDAEIARIHAEEELQMLIDGLDRNNETVAKPTISDKEMELWVVLKRLYEPDVEDQLWTHTQNLMNAPVEWKLYDICGVHHVTSKDKEIFMLVEKDYPLRKGIPTGSDEFPLPEQLPTAYEDKFPLLIQSDATAERITLLLKTGDSHGQRHSYTIKRRVTVTQLFRESVP
nr:hypothetical protein [Tanacetum cinerariifolium]